MGFGGGGCIVKGNKGAWLEVIVEHVTEWLRRWTRDLGPRGLGFDSGHV